VTVRRHGRLLVEGDPVSIAGAVRAVLDMSPIYRKIREATDPSVFATTVKPRWFLLGTPMTVDVARFVHNLTDERVGFAEGRDYLAELLGVGADDGAHRPRFR
jgi:hypothetical protein